MNDFLDVIRNNYANFSGRARRREYWMFMVVHSLIVATLSALFYIETAKKSGEITLNLTVVLTVIPPFIYILFTFIPLIALSIRRLHDIGISGRHIWPIFFPATSTLIAVLALFDSQPGSNHWGPNPKGVEMPVKAF
ncbi:DUF805 domain-containing protein [Deinococcus sp.]|uniref:DUF805 domain-containing protein n=1 Tax=Deinococcus sp. TaxID=47478 RepID=UPI003C79BDB4